MDTVLYIRQNTSLLPERSPAPVFALTGRCLGTETHPERKRERGIAGHVYGDIHGEAYVHLCLCMERETQDRPHDRSAKAPDLVVRLPHSLSQASPIVSKGRMPASVHGGG